jgi:hypothetical protein
MLLLPPALVPLCPFTMYEINIGMLRYLLRTCYYTIIYWLSHLLFMMKTFSITAGRCQLDGYYTRWRLYVGRRLFSQSWYHVSALLMEQTSWEYSPCQLRVTWQYTRHWWRNWLAEDIKWLSLVHFLRNIRSKNFTNIEFKLPYYELLKNSCEHNPHLLSVFYTMLSY